MMEEIYESKDLFVNFESTTIAFKVKPFRDEESGKLRFSVDLNDGHLRTIHHDYLNGWWQLTGPQIFTDILHFIGASLMKNYPMYF